ncbi:MAG: hypothetical protein Q7R77_01390 [Candidatus Daviesbacteria bacterium]|nr:hypothetical protein [Candidatus Daviesbacteria bacterium]
MPEPDKPLTVNSEIVFSEQEVLGFRNQAKEAVSREKQKPIIQDFVAEMASINPDHFKYHILGHAEDFAEEAAFILLSERSIEQKVASGQLRTDDVVVYDNPGDEYLSDQERVEQFTITDEDISDLIALGYLHDIRLKDVPFGNKGRGHEEMVVNDENILSKLKGARYSDARINLLFALTIGTQLRPTNFNDPPEDMILMPLPAREIYNRFNLNSCGIGFKKFKLLLGVARDSDLSNLGRPNSIGETEKVYFDENRTKPGMPGFKSDDYRDFIFRTWHGFFSPNDWHTRTAKAIYADIRGKNLEETRIEALKWAEVSQAKNTKIIIALNNIPQP